MLITIDPADSRSIYMQIVDEVRRGIVLGTLGPDGPLPSVRQLAAQLRVNPNTVAQAYRELERQELVYVRRGQGTFASPATASSVENERKSLAQDVARRALGEAYRHGLSADELIDALRTAETDRPKEGSE